jgi:mannose-6-phosphate isomerase-like protein (cupin superfamily)
MYVTRHDDARAYEAPGHFNVTTLRLQGLEVSPARGCWVGLSEFLPQGGAERSAGDAEKIYVVLSGEVTVVTDSREVTLGPLDSCYLEPGEARSIINRTREPASMLVIICAAEAARRPDAVR